MNKKIILILVLITIIIILIITKKRTPKELEIPKLKSNQASLTYKISAGIPFKWEHEIEDESILKFVNSYVIKDENTGGKVGAPVYTKYIFEGLKEGTTTLTFKYVNFADNYLSSEEKYNVTVDKELKTTITKLEE